MWLATQEHKVYAPLAHIRGPGYHVRQRDQWVPVQSAYVTSVV